MKKKNSIITKWIKCSMLCFLIAFIFSMIILELEQIDLIRGNSYYLSSTLIFIKTILWPVHYCIGYSFMAEIICQILFWLVIFLIPNEIREKQNIDYIIISIISNIINLIITVIIIFSNFNIVF